MTHRPQRNATAALVLAALLLSPTGLAQEPPADPAPAPATPEAAPPATVGNGRVEGKVIGRDGKPVSGAVVRAVHLRTEQTLASAPTDASGEFVLTGVPYGYVDVAIETSAGGFVSSQVVNVPPDRKVAVTFQLTRNEELPEGWWAGRPPRLVPGTDRPAIGVAQLQSRDGRGFWRTGTGIGILTGAGALALLALAGGGGGDEAPASPSSP